MRSIELAPRWTSASALTALIDVIFLLLMFFVCVSQYHPEQPNDSLALARSQQSQQPLDTPNIFMISLDHAGTMRVKKKAISIKQLTQKLNRCAKQSPPPIIAIRADHRCPFQYIQPVLWQCAQAGLSNVQFQVLADTRPVPSAGGPS